MLSPSPQTLQTASSSTGQGTVTGFKEERWTSVSVAFLAGLTTTNFRRLLGEAAFLRLFSVFESSVMISSDSLLVLDSFNFPPEERRREERRDGAPPPFPAGRPPAERLEPLTIDPSSSLVSSNSNSASSELLPFTCSPLVASASEPESASAVPVFLPPAGCFLEGLAREPPAGAFRGATPGSGRGRVPFAIVFSLRLINLSEAICRFNTVN